MEQNLYIVRHAHASHAESDEARPLSDKGLRQMERLCAALRGKGLIQASQIWHSPLTRAAQTAKALKEGLELDASLIERKGLAPFDNPSSIAKAAQGSEESLIIAGHEPNLSALASLLLSGPRAFEQIVFPKASILCLSRLKVGSQSTPWQIEWHINHRLFK